VSRLISDAQCQALAHGAGVSRGIDIEEIRAAARFNLGERNSHHCGASGRGKDQFAHAGM